MKLQAYGPMVCLKPMKSALEMQADKIGIIGVGDIMRSGAKTVFKQGEVVSMGSKVEGLKKGELVIFNPHDVDEWEDYVLVNAGAIVAKLQ